jgi:hypothetical protein
MPAAPLLITINPYLAQPCQFERDREALMSCPEHFDNRAAAYRQLAQNSSDPRFAGDMFEIASMFSSMAIDLRLLTQTPPKRERHRSWTWARRGWLRVERQLPLEVPPPLRG